MTHNPRSVGAWGDPPPTKTCCDACADDRPCDTECPDQLIDGDGPHTPSTLARVARIVDRPLIEPEPSHEVLAEILREVRAPVFEGKPLDVTREGGLSHSGLLKWENPVRGYRPEIEEIRFCVGDGTSAPGPLIPFQLAIVPYTTTVREAEFTISKGTIVNQALACFSFNGGSFSVTAPGIVVFGGSPYRIPYDAQSGKFAYLYWKMDLTLSVNPGRLVIHDRWVPAHEVFPPGTKRRPEQETV